MMLGSIFQKIDRCIFKDDTRIYSTHGFFHPYIEEQVSIHGKLRLGRTIIRNGNFTIEFVRNLCDYGHMELLRQVIERGYFKESDSIEPLIRNGLFRIIFANSGKFGSSPFQIARHILERESKMKLCLALEEENRGLLKDLWNEVEDRMIFYDQFCYIVARKSVSILKTFLRLLHQDCEDALSSKSEDYKRCVGIIYSMASTKGNLEVVKCLGDKYAWLTGPKLPEPYLSLPVFCYLFAMWERYNEIDPEDIEELIDDIWNLRRVDVCAVLYRRGYPLPEKCCRCRKQAILKKGGRNLQEIAGANVPSDVEVYPHLKEFIP